MRKAACEMCTTRITPKISVRPEASSAYTPPVRMPSAAAWRSSEPDGTVAPTCRGPPGSPGGLRVDRVRGHRRFVGRQDDLHGPALPLEDHMRALWLPALVERERPDHGVEFVLANVVAQGRL